MVPVAHPASIPEMVAVGESLVPGTATLTLAPKLKAAGIVEAARVVIFQDIARPPTVTSVVVCVE